METKIGNGVFYRGDCFDVMRGLPDGCVDMVLCDLPYGTTQNKWDSVLPLEPLWREYWRLCRGAVVLTAQCPFDKVLGVSALNELKYEWIWQKTAASGHLNAKKQPMKAHENVMVFCRARAPYIPQMAEGRPYNQKSGRASSNYGAQTRVTTENGGFRYPQSVQVFARDADRVHPTQKPVALFEYMIRTYTNEGMTVLDNTAGSGTTAIAAENAGRKWICIERDPGYYAKAVERVAAHVGQFPESLF